EYQNKYQYGSRLDKRVEQCQFIGPLYSPPLIDCQSDFQYDDQDDQGPIGNKNSLIEDGCGKFQSALPPLLINSKQLICIKINGRPNSRPNQAAEYLASGNLFFFGNVRTLWEFP